MAKEETKKKRPTAEKRNLQNKKRRLQNRNSSSQMRTAIRRFQEAVTEKDANIEEKLNTVYSILDKNVKSGVIKLNKASRTKARLAAKAAAAKT